MKYKFNRGEDLPVAAIFVNGSGQN
jgi:hypothetical protein